MMTPEELRLKVTALECLELAMTRLRRAESISCAYLYYNGHQARSSNDDESKVIRTALVDHYRSAALIATNELRCSGIDPSSLLNDVAA